MVVFDDEIKEIVKELEPAMVSCRRDLHKYPEVGWTEFRTAAKVIKKLQELGYEVRFGEEVIVPSEQMGVPEEKVLTACMERAISEGADPELVNKMTGGRTGVVGILRTGRPGKTVALRFDMDSLPLDEAEDEKHRPYREGWGSVHKHAMHACGHDGHTTVGLGVAEVLMRLKDKLTGTVKLLFQPAEEGVRGARAMAASGIVDDVDYLFGTHVTVSAIGTLGYDVNGLLATTKFDVDYEGVSAHAGSNPELGKNALLAAVTATQNLHAIAANSKGVTRISVGVLTAGTTRNAVPGHAHMEIETRGETTELNKYMFDHAKRIIQAAADMYDVKVTLKLMGEAAAGNSTPELSARARKIAERLQIFDTFTKDKPGASEDCSYLMERVQSHGGQAAYLTLGGSLAAINHNVYFDFDERFLAMDTVLLAALTSELLQG